MRRRWRSAVRPRPKGSHGAIRPDRGDPAWRPASLLPPARPLPAAHQAAKAPAPAPSPRRRAPPAGRKAGLPGPTRTPPTTPRPRSSHAPTRWCARCRTTRTRRSSTATWRRSRPQGTTAQPDDPSVTGSTLTETASVARRSGSGKPPPGVNPGNAAARPRARRFERAAADDQPGRRRSPTTRTRSRPGCAARRCSRTSSCARRSRTSTTSAFPSASCTRAAPARTASSSATSRSPTSRARRSSPRPASARRCSCASRPSPASAARPTRSRDVRGFAVKFYTDEGNWDLVGNNIPVFFIQDAMKFPDLVHAVKPEPHHQMPQAASAHDTFWDFVSLMPESTHMLMWVMSDRAIPRSYRMMQGFGVHTFRFVNAEGESRFVKFHWTPVAGTHSLVWDEAVKISGADPDFHRRDLWEAIEAGAYPECELGVQVFTEEDAESIELRRARRDQDRAGGTGAACARSAAWCSTAIRTTSSPRPSRSRSARRTSCPASTSPTIRCSPAASIRTSTRRSRASAGRTSTRSRSTRRSRPGAQQPARRLAPPGDPPRPRQLRAELARRRLSVPGRACRASRRSREPIARRQGARQAREVRRPLHAGDAVLAAARRRSSRRTSSARSASSSPRVQVAGGARARASRCSPTSPTSSRTQVAHGPRHRRARAAAAASLEPRDAGSRASRPRCRCCRAARRRQHPRRGASRSWSATGVDGEARARCTRACCRPARCRASSARASADPWRRTATGALEVEVDAGGDALGAVRRARRARTATGARSARATSATRSSSSRTSTATASRSSRSAPAAALIENAGVPATAALGRGGSRACCWSTTTMPPTARRAFVAAIARHRHFERELDPAAV